MTDPAANIAESLAALVSLLAAHYPAYSETGQAGHDGARCDKRPKSRDGKCTDPRENSQSSTDNATSRCAGSSAFRCFGVLLMGEVPGACRIGQKNRDVATWKTGCHKSVNCLLRMRNR